jgi:hypothetical protein
MGVSCLERSGWVIPYHRDTFIDFEDCDSEDQSAWHAKAMKFAGPLQTSCLVRYGYQQHSLCIASIVNFDVDGLYAGNLRPLQRARIYLSIHIHAEVARSGLCCPR